MQPSRRPCSLFDIPVSLPCKMNGISASDLAELLKAGCKSSPKHDCDTIVFDCRKYDRYSASHIVGAISYAKWLSSHPVSSFDIVKTFTSRNDNHHPDSKFVIYDEDSTEFRRCNISMLHLVEELQAEGEGIEVFLLIGGFSEFSKQFPNFCNPEDITVRRLNGCQNREIQDSNSLPVQSPSLTLPLTAGSSRNFSSCFVPEKSSPSLFLNPMSRVTSMLIISPDHTGPDAYCSILPSEILPHVFIGSECDAKDSQFLQSRHITHVLNVTTHIPCFYEKEGSLRYKRLPACDTNNDNLRQYFDEASDFIDEAERSRGIVLVHCQAGISRSPSIVLAYLISRKNMAFQEAYQLIARLRPIIAPNFNFLAQLNEFENEVASSRRSSGEITAISSLSSSSDYEHDEDEICNNSDGRGGMILNNQPLPKRCKVQEGFS